jgi:hypothetical protein
VAGIDEGVGLTDLPGALDDVIGRAAALEKKEALKEIRTVLRSEILREAFRKIGLPKTDPKLKVLLLFVRYRQAWILYRYYSRMKK